MSDELQGAGTLLADDEAPPWGLPRRVGFRFVFVYFLLYNLSSFVGSVCSLVAQGLGLFSGDASTDPSSTWTKVLTAVYTPASWVREGVQESVVWLTRTCLDAKITNFPNGSGDTQYNYYELEVFAAVSVAVTLLWTAFDLRWRPRHHERLHRALRVYIRYVLAFTMIGYGMVKVIKLQFPAPGLVRLTETYGESSPMGILWAMMGASWGYNVFAGLGETIGGLLLFWRRTTLLGALLSAGVMANVVALNFCYDVPVKLYSSHLMLQAMFLAGPSMARICTLLLTDRSVPAVPLVPLFTSKVAGWIWFSVKTLVVIGYMTQQVIGGLEGYRSYGDGAPRPSIYGLYSVEQFSRGEPLTTPEPERSRWLEVIIDKTSPFNNGMGMFRARTVDRTASWFQYKLDEGGKTLTLITAKGPRGPIPLNATPAKPPVESALRYTEDGDRLSLEGELDGEPISVTLRRKPMSDFLLINRGFNWVNNFPYNK